ncbi:MAG: punA [Bacteroidetes bacterium]|nr:punA [Bacteroidota bacterium]
MTDNSRLEKAITHITSRITQRPAVAVVLGSGLGDFADRVVDPIEITASSIPSYPISSVAGHEGKLIFGKLKTGTKESLPLLIFKGRVHFFETNDLKATTFPISVAKALGARFLLATNAAGGINPAFSEGDLMLIEDFMDLSFLNPHQENHSSTTTLFHASVPHYLDKQISGYITDASAVLGITLRRGTYCWLKGPSYETKAEIEMLRRLGADAVGMSTVPEVILATELGMRTGAISLISNMAAGLSEGRLSHEEVAVAAGRVKEIFTALLEETILRIKD